MPGIPWLVHFPDDDATEVAPRRELPQPGDEIFTGWVVTDYKVSKQSPTGDQVDVWVTAKARRRTIRQRTDRR